MSFTSTPYDYLSFTSSELIDVLKVKLSEDEQYTDLLYTGSNLATLMDAFAFIFETLMYSLNHGASESMPMNAQFYENMNMLVKFLGYSPRGFTTSTVTTKMSLSGDLDSSGIYTIPKFTTVETELTDNDGLPIRFTFIDSYPFTASDVSIIDSDFTPLLYNGTWKVYPKVFTATGGASESFALPSLVLDGDDKTYISHQHFDVYVLRADGSYYNYKPTASLFNSEISDRHFAYRIDENKQYVLTFGDGVNGATLQLGDLLYVVYLQSNGAEGQIGVNNITTDAPLSVGIEGFTEQFIKENILKVDDNPEYILFGTDAAEQLSKIRLNNEDISSFVSDLETVDEIRESSPRWFRTDNRLVTPGDFEQYIKNTYPNEIHDVKVFNNWKYLTSFQRWAYDYNILSPDLSHYGYTYADSCNFNNIYLWMKGFSTNAISTSSKSLILQDCDRIKCMTAELIPLDPIFVYFVPYLEGTYDITAWDNDAENTIILIRSKNSMVSYERIKQNATNIIQTFFDTTNNSIGQIISVETLHQELLSIDGVKEIKMRYLAKDAPITTATYFEGLSFGLFTIDLINGADFTSTRGSYHLRDFQFPILYDSELVSNRLLVTSESNTALLEY